MTVGLAGAYFETEKRALLAEEEMSIVACSFQKTWPILYPVVEVLLPIPLVAACFPMRGESKLTIFEAILTLCSYSDKVNQEHSPSKDWLETLAWSLHSGKSVSGL